jgi:hypothetical protein
LAGGRSGPLVRGSGGRCVGPARRDPAVRRCPNRARLFTVLPGRDRMKRPRARAITLYHIRRLIPAYTRRTLRRSRAQPLLVLAHPSIVAREIPGRLCAKTQIMPPDVAAVLRSFTSRRWPMRGLSVQSRVQLEIRCSRKLGATTPLERER